jgi:hypothetical protein
MAVDGIWYSVVHTLLLLTSISHLIRLRV